MTSDREMHPLEYFARRVADADARAIERACEAALKTGTMGVLVNSQMQPGEGAKLVYTVDARPDPSVPFGTIQWASR